MSVRMKDIARDLGISLMAVSKALRNHADIGKETKERVLKRAAELNYRVDWIARSMVTGRTYLVGLVVPDLMQSFFAEIATALNEVLAPAGYHLLISHTNENAAEEEANINLLVSRKVDGLVIASAQRSARLLEKLTTPYVLIDRTVASLNANFVGTLNEDVGFIATEHLIAQGWRRIAHLAGPSVSTARDRLRGYRKALKKHGIEWSEDLVVKSGHDDAAGYRAMQVLLARRPRPDAVCCFNDPVAIGAMRAVFDAGLTVPNDVALIGAANMHYSDLLRVPLSTVDQGTAAIGSQAARLLLDRMSKPDESPRQVTLPPRLIVRGSSMKPDRPAA